MAARLSRVVLITGILTARLALAAVPARVAIIKTSALTPFNQAADAIIEVLRNDPLQPEILTFDLEGDEARAAGVLAEVRRLNPRLVVVVGSLATAVALKELPSTPIIFSMVLYPRQSGFLADAHRNVTGVSLDVPPAVQFGYLRRLFPAAHRIGVLYNPSETGSIVEEARSAAAAHGFTLVPESVADPAQAVAALGTLMEECDAIWSVADSHVFTPQTTSALLLAATRRRVPLFGLSTAQVRAGAVAALYCDYADVGKQTGESVLRALRGEAPDTIEVSPPRKAALALNLRTAEHLGLHIADDLQAQASEVIR